jgi:CheY-like chemotaxis protein
MRIFILEDSIERIRKFKQKLIGHELVIATEAQQGIDFLNNFDPFDYIFLDHDLGGQVYQLSGKDTGYEVAEWLSKNPNKATGKIIIHSLNNQGAIAMGNILKDNNIRSLYIPFVWEKIQID